MNVFEERDDSLAKVDYAPMLDAVAKAIRDEPELFKVSAEGRVMADVSKVAESVSGNKNLPSPLVAGRRGMRAATVNFADGRHDAFYEKVRGISSALETSFARASEEMEKSGREVAEGLCFPMGELRTKGAPKPGFGYDFPENRGVGRRRLRLQKHGEPGGKSCLSLHRLTVEIDVSDFDENLARSLENYMERRSPDEIEDVRDLLEHALHSPEGREESGLAGLRELLSEEALGIMKREASVFYLDFLLDGMNPDDPGVSGLRRMRDRMLAFRDFVDDATRSDTDFIVRYGAGECDLREKFSLSDALEPLPVVAMAEGSLGESRDDERGRLRYVYGLKFKLNGRVASTSHPSSLDYHVDLIDPDTPLHKTTRDKRGGGERIARHAALYAFFFDPGVEDARSPSSPMAEAVMSALKNGSQMKKEAALRELASELRSPPVSRELHSVETLLRRALSRDAAFAEMSRLAHVGVGEGIVERDAETILESGSFLREEFDGNPKALLKHVSVDEADRGGWLFSAPVKIEVSNPRFSETAHEPETFTMTYEVDDMHVMPVFMGLLRGSGSGHVRDLYENHIHKSGHPYLLFPYGAGVGGRMRDESSAEAFVYSFVFALLSFLAVEMMLSHTRRDVYVPILRFQTKKKDEPLAEETFLRSLSKTIAHLISECPLEEGAPRRVSRSQGLVVPPERYALKNAAASMYAGTSMRFSETSPTTNSGARSGVDKFAILAVSSWECDAMHPSDRTSEAPRKLSCVHGEAVCLDRKKDGSVLVEQFGTFADVYDEAWMHHRPEALRDVVESLHERGYRHIALISKSPFRSRMPLSGDGEKLFFLSKETLAFLRSDHHDLHIYPVFTDRYYVVKPGKASLKANSLYIQDVGELRDVVRASRNTIPFLHVFNGISVGRETFYNGTLAYSAVTGAYEGVLDESATWANLLFDDDGDGGPNVVKDDIVRYLTLFHFSRFEKSGGGLGFSLNPFSGLFEGSESVGGASAFPHAAKGHPAFNSLAFLSKAKESLLRGKVAEAR